MLAVVLSGLATIIGSGGNGDGDGDRTYEYNITSTTYFTGGQEVAVIRFGISGSCNAFTGVTTPITRVGSGTVTSPGSVSFSFTTDINPPFVESVYIDNNASGNLDSGDRVWGDNPNDLAASCFDAMNSNQTFDWEVVAAQIQAILGLSQPSIIYTGPSQSFRTQPSSGTDILNEDVINVDGDDYNSIQESVTESELFQPQFMIDNFITVDGDSYDSIQW